MSNPILFAYNVHKSNNKHRLNKEKRKRETWFMMLAYWMPFLIVISFDAGFATHHPLLRLRLLGCWVQVGIGLLGDSVWANWAHKFSWVSQHAQKERVSWLKHWYRWFVNSRGVSTVVWGCLRMSHVIQHEVQYIFSPSCFCQVVCECLPQRGEMIFVDRLK